MCYISNRVFMVFLHVLTNVVVKPVGLCYEQVSLPLPIFIIPYQCFSLTSFLLTYFTLCRCKVYYLPTVTLNLLFIFKSSG